MHYIQQEITIIFIIIATINMAIKAIPNMVQGKHKERLETQISQ